MKYKKGDLVKIKSMTWWEENKPKNFPREMADDCCGMIVEIREIDINEDLFPYFITSGCNSWWLHEDWVESKVGIVKIKLGQMKNEI